MIKLKEAVPVSFGRFKNETIKFTDGFQVIYGQNETGKSTLQLFLRVMLYGMPVQRRLGKNIIDRDRAIPWHERNAEGILRLEADGRNIEIHRFFGKTAAGDKVETVDAATGEPIPELCCNDIGGKLLGMSESMFEKTMWIRQGSVFPTGKDEEISKKLMNLCDTGDEDISAEHTLKNLDAIIKSIRAKDKRSTPGRLDVLRKEKEEKTEERYRLTSMIRQRETAEKKLGALKESLRETEKKIERLAEDEQTQIELRALEDKAKKWNQAKNLKDRVEQYETDDRFRRYCNITFEEAAEAEKLENLIDTIDQSQIKSYDIDESGCYPGSAGRWIAAFGCVIAAAVILTMSLRLMVMPIAAILIIFGVFVAVLGAVMQLRERKSAAEKLKHVTELKNEIAEREAEKTKLRNALDVVLKKYGCRTASELREHALYCNEIRMESEKLMCAYNAVTEGENLEDLHEAAVKIDASTNPGIIYRDIQAEIKEQREQQTRLQQEISELGRASGYVTGELKNPAEIDAELAAIDDDIKEQETRLKAAEMADKVFRKVYERRRSDFTPVLNKKVNEYLKTLTNGRYSDIRISDEYNIRISPDGGNLYDLGYFSCGACDQIYLALRLAIGALTGDGKEPVFIDDMLTAYDDERASAAAELLSKMSEERQVIMFTCHRRDMDNAEQLGAVIKKLEEE